MMCRKRDADCSHPAVVRLPAAVEALRGRRSCDEEEEVEVEMEEEEEYTELEEEFLRFCVREKKMTAASRRSSAAATAKKHRAETPTRDESAASEEKMKSNGGKRRGGKAGGRRSKHGFRGVHRRTYGRWAAEIRDVIKGSRVWIGTYDTAEAAARAYDVEARRIHGHNVRTNFPPPPPSPAVTNSTTEPVVLPAAGEPAGEPPAPVALARALVATDGWEFEPYSRVLLGGFGLLGCADDDKLGGATSNAGDGYLWLF